MGGGDVQVIVVAYGTVGVNEVCLRNLSAKYPVTIVDNSSLPENLEMAQRLGATYIDSGSNLGFAAGVNLALARLNPDDDVLLLNPDAFVEISVVSKLREVLYEVSNTACVAPAQHAPGSARLDRVFWPFPGPGRAWMDAFGLGRMRHSDGFLIGSVLLLRASAIAQVGLFDERFFLYAEEADWQRRARKAGWAVRYCSDLMAEHVGAGTGGDPRSREVYFHSSQALFVRKWSGPVGWQIYRAAAIAGAVLRVIFGRGEARQSAARRLVLYLKNPIAEGRRIKTIPTMRWGSSEPPVAKTLRVVHVVCTDAFAGVERYVITLATALTALGCQVTVVGGDRTQMLEELQSAGITWYEGSTIRSATLRLLSLGQFDIAHVHMTKAELAAAISLPGLRSRVVATRHFARQRGSSAPARLFGRLLSRIPAQQLAISHYVARAVEGTSVVIEPGVPKVAELIRSEDRRCTVLMVQRLEKEKETEVGLEAFAKSGLAQVGWNLMIAGGGAMADELRRRASSLGIADSVRFLGPRSDVGQLYRSAAIFLATRRDEPFGISVVEAMANALPVVCVSGGGHLETVGLCQSATMFPGGDSTRAAELLRELAGDARRRDIYGAELQALQRERFTPENQAQRTLAVYSAVSR